MKNNIMKNSNSIKLLFIGAIFGILGTLFVDSVEEYLNDEMIVFGKTLNNTKEVHEKYDYLSYRSHMMDTLELKGYMVIMDSLIFNLNDSYIHYIDKTKFNSRISTYSSKFNEIDEKMDRSRERFEEIYDTEKRKIFMIEMEKEYRRINAIN
jgi:hypothetical protein